MSATLRINGERLWSRLMAMAEIGATDKGGCNRQALTDEDRAGRELFMQWCRAAGCDVRIDAIGNIFARRPGTGGSIQSVITGSHLDTQPTGGKFDGIYGVLAGLEVIESLNDAGVKTRHPMDVVVWTNEEGCRFDCAMMGSAVWSGAMSLEDAYALSDRDGNTVEQELQRIGHLGHSFLPIESVKAAFEAHIEQGPVLEASDKTIGVVSGVQHMSRHRIVIHGQEAHAGPTPMPMRKDPMMALADFLPDLYRLADQHAPHGRVTFGFIDAQPGSPNTVPGRLELTVDLRHPEKTNYQTMLRDYKDTVQRACQKLDLDHSNECVWEAPGVEFDPHCIAAVRKAVETAGYPHSEMFSGAGHDACNVASVVPTSMIFIPCEGGISHNEAENTTQGQAEAGANILLHAMLDQAIVE